MTFQFLTTDARAGDATVISMQVAALAVSNVGSVPLLRTQSPAWKRIVLTSWPLLSVVDVEHHTSLCALVSIPARRAEDVFSNCS
jgi:hypothetical protein